MGQKFKCPVEGCTVEIPKLADNIQEQLLRTHKLDKHGALHTPLGGHGG